MEFGNKSETKMKLVVSVGRADPLHEEWYRVDTLTIES